MAFCKILDSNKYDQILVTKRYDQEATEKPYSVHLEIQFEGMIATICFGTDSTAEQNEMFDTIDLDVAEEFLKDLNLE